jgi:predicted nucleotidyltransferase
MGDPAGGITALETVANMCFGFIMVREDVIATLRSHEPELRHRGVRHAALFGSMARGEATPASDIDIMIELEPDSHIGVYGYVAIMHYLADLFPMPVDVANQSTLKPHVRPSAERDAVYAF